MPEIKLHKRCKYAGDVFVALLKMGYGIEAANAFCNNIKDADVKEVKHGQWRSVEGDVIFACSNCYAEVSTSWDYENDDMFAYCPCCGAKMDGETEKEE